MGAARACLCRIEAGSANTSKGLSEEEINLLVFTSGLGKFTPTISFHSLSICFDVSADRVHLHSSAAAGTHPAGGGGPE